MGNSSDLYADSTLVSVFLPLSVEPLADGYTDLLVAAMSPDTAYG